jgi:hypothetical protein
MVEEKPRIAPPPSVDDVLSALTDQSRIGQVDFTAALAPEPVERRTARGPAQPEAKRTLRRVPEPTPAPITEPEPRDEEPVSEPEPEPVVEEPAVEEPAVEEPEPEPVGEESTPPARPQGTKPRTAERPLTVVEEPPARSPSQPEPQPAPEQVAAPVDVARAVEEIAEGVIRRIQAAEQATMRHLEAMELEATRRYELVTAQAELDAELIRLQSRREAHAIITAARMRSGELDDVHDDPGDEGHRLAVLSDAISRVADTTESSLTRPRTPETGSST